MSTANAFKVPEPLAASYARVFGAEGRAWIATLPALAADLLERWELKRDGEAGAGEASLVLPVLRKDGTRAVLRLQMPREETTAALIGLRRWNGEGMVRLLDHDPESSAMLLERLDGAHTLTSIEDDDVAMTILAQLQARLVCVPDRVTRSQRRNWARLRERPALSSLPAPPSRIRGGGGWTKILCAQGW